MRKLNVVTDHTELIAIVNFYFLVQRDRFGLGTFDQLEHFRVARIFTDQCGDL